MLLCDNYGFLWKVLSSTLRTQDKGIAIFVVLGVKVGFVLLMARHIAGFKRYWASVEGLEQMGGVQ
jgi:hypothetical protein